MKTIVSKFKFKEILIDVYNNYNSMISLNVFKRECISNDYYYFFIPITIW